MTQRHTVALICLTLVVLVLTGATVRGSGDVGLLGVVAPVIVPAILTLWLIAVLAYGRSIIDALAAILLSRPKEPKEHRNSLLGILVAWVLIFALVSLMTRPEVYQTISGAIQQMAGFLVTRLGVAPPSPNVSASPSKSTLLLFYYSIVIFAAIIVVSFSMIFASFYRAYREVRARPVGVDSAARREVLSAVHDARTKLEANGSYHEVILECYRRMCQVLSNKGFAIAPSETAREFSEDVSRKLELGRASVNGLTYLFEEARYSDHVIEDEKRLMAVRYLSSLEQSLVGRIVA